MSGHNKWSKIKRKKEVEDKVKGNIFSKMARLITLAVIQGGGIGDPANNVKLRLAIEKAKQFNMPKENIKRAIERGIGSEKNQLQEIIYEGFGPGGVALLIVATTDNPNRTLGEVRTILDKHEGKLGSQGAVSYLFKKCGLAVFEKSQITEEQILALADKLEAFDIEETNDRFYVYFPFENLGHIENTTAEIDFKPLSTITAPPAIVEKIDKLTESLESLDDVHRVYTNINIK